MKIKKSKIEFEASKQFSSLFIDYIKANADLKEFYLASPHISSFQPIIERFNFDKARRKKLVDVILSQYKNSRISIPPNVSLLLNENSFTVCTGHQLCLFTGPLYFIYKIISTINLSEELKQKYSEYDFIPVYWMASEDHDYDEIKSIHLFGKTVTWENPNARGAVGRISTDGLQAIIDELKILLGETDNSLRLIELFKSAYINSNNIASATRMLVNELFARYNLVVLDPDDKELKTSFGPIMADDIFNATNHSIVNKSIQKLSSMGYSIQVNPREINCFYLTHSSRERIERQGDKYVVLNTLLSFTKEELEQELKLYPEKFSPNVVLRPMYQQLILPNIAYVGGPGELAYWLEYKNMFECHNVQFPILVPRNFSLLIDAKSQSQLNKLGFTLQDLIVNNEDVLIREMVKQNATETISVKEEEEAVSHLYKQLSEKVGFVDSTLKATVEAELQKALSSLKNIENKMLKSEKQKQEIGINQLKKIRAKVLPSETLQERYENFASYYLKYGEEFIVTLKQEFKLFDWNILVIELE